MPYPNKPFATCAMKTICQAGIAGTFLYIALAHADPGVSSLEGLWLLYLVLGLIVCVLIICGIFWMRITWSYLLNNANRFHRLKLYVFLSVTFIVISGASAFTFHPDAPYSQNPYFLFAALIVAAMSTISIVVQYRKSRRSPDRT